MEEKLYDIKGYEGRYAVTKSGKVWSYPKYKHNGKFVKTNKANSSGYYVVSLTKNKIKKTYSLHRLIIETFISNTENKPQVNHINGIKTDNRIENLEWVNASENSIHAFNLGIKKISDKNRKITSLFCKETKRKLSMDIAEKIRTEYVKEKISQRELAKKYKISQAGVNRLLLKKAYND